MLSSAEHSGKSEIFLIKFHKLGDYKEPGFDLIAKKMHFLFFPAIKNFNYHNELQWKSRHRTVLRPFVFSNLYPGDDGFIFISVN